jgi:hypothetical protein
MSGAGNHVNWESTAGASVEPPPRVVLVLTNVRSMTETKVSVKLGETVETDIGVEVEVVEVVRAKLRPANKPPYKFLITATDGSYRVVRSMDEANAVRLWHNSNDEPLTVESVEAVIPGV